MTSDRFHRQADLVPQERLRELSISVIGVGAIGRQVTLQLAALGARRLQLIDFDHVDESNITTQGYRRQELGLPKLAALAKAVIDIEPAVQLDLIPDRFRPQQRTGAVVFCCVDSISTRAAIWKALKERCRFWGDGRMLGEVVRILCAADDAGRRHYGTTLFPPAEAQAGRCTAHSTLYAASTAAGLLIHQFTRWLRNLQVDADLTMNLLGSELVTNV